MLDIREIANDLDGVAARLAARGVDRARLTDLTTLYGERKTLQGEADALKAEKNTVSKEIGRKKKNGEDATEEMERSKEIGARIGEIDKKLAEVEEQVDNGVLDIPNLPHESVPVGANEEANVEVRTWGEPKKYDFEVKDHVALGEALGILDFERGAKLAGARFTLLAREGARLQRALINFFVDLHTQHHGYEEVWPPFLVNRKAATGTGNLPKFEDDLFKIADPELFLIPTAEVPVTNIHAGEILPPDSLPKKWCAYTPCFRREAGSYGKDVRGMIRNHQFEKVEMVQYSTPEASWEAHEELTGHAEVALQKLDLPYRVVTLSTGDMGFSAAKTYDLEVWLPSQEKHREISSCSNFTDFQARRANIRFRREKGAKPEFVHTLNGSGLAVGRSIVAILENHQQADGSITIPEPLRPYFGGDKIG